MGSRFRARPPAARVRHDRPSCSSRGSAAGGEGGRARAPIVVDRNLPAPLRQALRQSREVVAVVIAPGVPGDADAVQEARAGAAAAHVGFAVLNVKQDPVAAALAAWAPTAGDPAVLVVKRPGTIAVELDGYADREMVAQAALDETMSGELFARRRATAAPSHGSAATTPTG